MAQESTTFADRETSLPDRWPGTARYEVIGTLGEGGMGVVYEAFDRERNKAIAVKTLLRFDAAALYLFKQEFRTLADVRHPNLVRLYELVVPDAGQVFFTMELVRGVDFRAYVQKEVAQPRSGTVPSGRPAERETLRPRAGGPANAPSPRRTGADVDRLRPALRQLVAGVQALHAAGKLHRDIKPSNILVTSEGRVVLLDFGVATEMTDAEEPTSSRAEMVGTARYMAPEQACSEPPSFASDWYSVGVVLYEALVGRPPFTGSAVDVLTMKTTLDPEPPSTARDGVPPDLDALCMALLAREPSDRPAGEEVLRRLGVSPSAPPPPLAEIAPEGALIGRDTHLRALRGSLEVVRGGRSVAVHLSGAPGMGKSTVAHAFLDELARGGSALVLRSRAYERETVPYKAIDSAIDALSKHLLRLADAGALPALPEDMWALAKVFPVLQRGPMPPPPRVAPAEDPQALRRRASHALMLLLAALAKQQPLVLFIDDAQWGDVDSASLLLDFVRSPDAPPFLLVMTHRAEEAKTSPFLSELRGRWPETVLVGDIDVGPLSFDDAQKLALTLLGTEDDAARRTARAAARESRGSPFLVEELVRSNRVSASQGPTLAVLTLDQMVSERIERLSPSARELLEVTAVGGRPLPVSVVAAASGSPTPDDDIATGVARRFLRAGLRDGRDVVEITHDRIRETIVAQLPDAALREHHGRLAAALQDTANADAEAIATHWLLAGDRARAAEYAESAAEQAASKLAFDQAARLVRLAIEHTPPSSPNLHPLRKRLGELLKNDGRAVESARVYLSLVEGASQTDRVEFQRIAAEQLLVAGCIDEGAELLHRVLRAAGMTAPRTPIAAIFWMLVYRVWLAVLGLRIVDRKPEDVTPEARARIEALFTATSGFSIVDVVLSACMQARHLIEALRYGDRFQLLRAVCLDAAHLSAAGGPETARELRLVEIARGLADREGTPEAAAYFAGARGIGLFQRGRWLEASEMLAEGQKVMLYELAGFSTVRMFALYTQFFLGRLSEGGSLLARLCEEAEDRGDRYTVVNVRTSVGVHVSLSIDDVAGARRVPEEALQQWTQQGFRVQHWQAMAYAPDVDLYAGTPSRAYERFRRDLTRLRRSLLLHAGFIRAVTFSTRARYAVASIQDAPEARRSRLREALGMARRLDREADPWTRGLAAMARACAHNAAGDRDRAIEALRAAIAHNEASSTFVYLEPVRYRLGQLLGGPAGEAMRASAQQAMRAQGVKEPERWAQMYMPGAWERTP